MKVIAIDPGGETGICIINENKEILKTYCLPREDINLKIATLIFDNMGEDELIVVVEDYRSNVITRSQKYPIELIGFIKGTCEIRNIELHMQMPTSRKGYYTLIERENLLPNEPKHVRDALAHALRYLNQKGVK
jgi:predicted RNase H-like nuclease (RuvC/YqgF family)